MWGYWLTLKHAKKDLAKFKRANPEDQFYLYRVKGNPDICYREER